MKTTLIPNELLSALEAEGADLKDEPMEIKSYQDIEPCQPADDEEDIPKWRSSGKRKKPYQR